MKKNVVLIVLVLMFLTGCQSNENLQGQPTSETQEVLHTPTTRPIILEPGDVLPPFTVDLSGPFSNNTTLTTWTPQPYAGLDYTLPVDPSRVANPQVIAGLTDEQLDFLKLNGFVVIHSQDESFLEIRESVGEFQGQPYFLTVDSAFHALHVNFDETLKSIEKERLYPQIQLLIDQTLNQIFSYRSLVSGFSIEDEVENAAAYLSVALKLFNPDAVFDPALTQQVNEQIDLIMAGQGRAFSPLIEGFEDDYGAYKPVGHYAGDEELERYFRGMTWLGRVHNKFEEIPQETSKVPLIITLALRQVSIDGRTGAEVWAEIHEVLSFLVGPTDDGGPMEYAQLMDSVYGNQMTVAYLADEDLWEDFFNQRDQIPTPKINSTFVDWVSTDMEGERGWRFMGQRFTLDGFIFQNLIFDMVEPLNGQRRDFPTGLDIMAVFGSQAAMDSLEAMGETAYPNYLDQMEMLQAAAQSQTEEEWLGTFYNSWLYSFLPVLESKEDKFPGFMQTTAWGYKDVNAVLGSWTELKHDTILYSKMPEGAGGGGPPTSGPAPGFVEPNPEAFYRLGYAALSLFNGLSMRGYDTYESNRLDSIGERFIDIGNIAAKELRGETLEEWEYDRILDCFGLECIGTSSPYSSGGELKKVPLIAAVSGAKDSVLEAAIGYIDRIYVVVPIEDELHIAQGGVFSYYEFIQPRSNRLTDEEWREMLAKDPPDLPPWASNLVFQGGQPTYWLYFRIGDVYEITAEGEGLIVRESPSLSGEKTRTLKEWNYIEIIDGPVKADGYTWWKIGAPYDSGEIGWIIESQVWFERSW